MFRKNSYSLSIGGTCASDALTLTFSEVLSSLIGVLLIHILFILEYVIKHSGAEVYWIESVLDDLWSKLEIIFVPSK